MIKYESDLKIGDNVTVNISGKEKDVKITDIILQAYISDYKVVVKYVDKLNIEYTDFVNSFLERVVFEGEFDSE